MAQSKYRLTVLREEIIRTDLLIPETADEAATISFETFQENDEAAMQWAKKVVEQHSLDYWELYKIQPVAIAGCDLFMEP